MAGHLEEIDVGPRKRDPMSIERVYHCDWRECENHSRTASDSVPTAMITVTEGTDRPLHFCGWDCLLRHAAEKPPAEVISLGDC
jgi:hypothetical protein